MGIAKMIRNTCFYLFNSVCLYVSDRHIRGIERVAGDSGEGGSLEP